MNLCVRVESELRNKVTRPPGRTGASLRSGFQETDPPLMTAMRTEKSRKSWSRGIEICRASRKEDVGSGNQGEHGWKHGLLVLT